MKKLLKVLVVLCIIYFSIIWIQRRLVSNLHISYIINTQNEKFEINEIYHKKTDQQAQYWLQIQVHNTIFPIQVSASKGKKKLVEDVYYFENEAYTCIYPIGKNMPSVDILCAQDQTIYPYSSIIGIDSEVDAFASSLQYYDATQFVDYKNLLKVDHNISIYDSFIENHIIGLENYKGLYVLDSTDLVKEKKLFTNDIYQKSTKIFYQQYYIVADYNENYEFHEFFVINMQTLKETKIISDTPISLNSYIQGMVKDSIYVMDRTNKRQYRIDLSNKTVTKIGEIDSGVQIYKNGVWSKMTMYDALKDDVYFVNTVLPNEISDTLYAFYQQVGNYYYLYQKNENDYTVYRIHEQMPNIRYYITRVSDIHQVSYLGDYFYWKEKDSIYYYHDSIGSRVIVKNPEMEFNSDLQFGIYTK